MRSGIVLVAAALGAGACWAATPAEIDAAVKRGLDYLMTRQEADGHFSDASTPALTALPLWAMTSAGKVGCEQAHKAAKFVLAAQKEDGGFYATRKPPLAKSSAGNRPTRNGSGGPGGLSTYNTAVCLTALYESGLAPNDAVLKARNFLAASQLGGDDTMAGGFGYGQVRGPRRYADLSNTSYAMDAMRRTEKAEEFRADGTKRADLDWDKALKFVTNLQEKDGERRGGAAYNERTPQGGVATNKAGRVRLMAYGSMSYAAVMSMAHAKLTKGDPRVRNALAYCARNWTVDENPGMGTTGLFYYYDILSRALSVADVPELNAADGRSIAWRKELSDKLVGLQKTDGSWANENNRFWEADPVLCTSFAVIALELCKEKVAASK